MTQQVFEFPEPLARLVEVLRYKPGWTIELKVMDRGQGSSGLTLDITTNGYDSYHPERGQHYRVHHLMPVPPAAFNSRSWRRWLLDQLVLVETHEAMEFFVLEHRSPEGFRKMDGSISPTHQERPYAPNHGPGNNPYTIFDQGTSADARTSFRGVMKPDDDEPV